MTWMRNENRTAAVRLDLHTQKQYILKNLPIRRCIAVAQAGLEFQLVAFHRVCTSALAQTEPVPGWLSSISARLEPGSAKGSKPSFMIRKGGSRKICKKLCKGDNLYIHPHISVPIDVSFYLTLFWRSLAFVLFKVSTLK